VQEQAGELAGSTPSNGPISVFGASVWKIQSFAIIKIRHNAGYDRVHRLEL